MVKAAFRKIYHGVLSALPPHVSLSIQHLKGVGRLPDLASPRTFNEKVLYRKLHEQNELFARLSDKVAVKDYVAEKCGSDIVIPTLWHGTELPDDCATRFTGPIVLKSNHASGTNLFITDPATADWDSIRRTAAGWLRKRYNSYAREGWYDRVARQLLVEPLIGDGGVPPSDYKFFVFEGRVECIQLDLDRFSGHKRSFHARNWERLPVALTFPQPDDGTQRPRHLDEMIAIAERMASDFSFVRVDLYDLPPGPKFGELTFAPGGGVVPFMPFSFDRQLGGRWVGNPRG